MDEIKLSVLVTTYNLENYIDETLQSIFSQKTKYNFEVIIGDDGSNDGTIFKIKKWQQQYPQQIQYYIMSRDHQKKYNPIHRASANRLNIVQYASGKYITFLDGDDFYIDENKFQKQIDILEKKENQDCSICMHNMNYYYENQRTIIMENKLVEGKITGREFWKQYYIPAEGCIFRNYFKQEIPNFINSKYFDDNIIIYIGLMYGDIYYIPDAMANYRQHNTPWNELDELKKAFINIIDYDYEININPKMKKESLIRHYQDIKKLKKNANRLEDMGLDKIWEESSEEYSFTAKNLLYYSHLSFIKKVPIIVKFIIESIFFWKWIIQIKIKNLFISISIF